MTNDRFSRLCDISKIRVHSIVRYQEIRDTAIFTHRGLSDRGPMPMRSLHFSFSREKVREYFGPVLRASRTLGSLYPSSVTIIVIARENRHNALFVLGIRPRELIIESSCEHERNEREHTRLSTLLTQRGDC